NLLICSWFEEVCHGGRFGSETIHQFFVLVFEHLGITVILMGWSVHRQKQKNIDIPHSKSACEETRSRLGQNRIFWIITMKLSFSELLHTVANNCGHCTN